MDEQPNHTTAIPGAPRWVTPDLLHATRATWQPYYTPDLTIADALEILLGVSRLIDALQESASFGE